MPCVIDDPLLFGNQILKRKSWNAMQGYRAFIVGPDGHVTDRVDLPGLTEEEAKKRAKQLISDNAADPRSAVELWQGSRKIARYEPTQK